MNFPFLLSAFVYGLCLGSFLNVCIHRLPKDQSLIHPRSRCPHCHKQIEWYDNIPVLSFFALRGKCRHCRKPISWRYPLIELAVASLVVLMVWRWQGDPVWSAVAGGAAGVLLAIAVIDWETFLIPDPLSLGLLVVGLCATMVNPLFEGGAFERFASSFGGAAVGFLMTWLTAVIGEKAFGQEALGGGDIKLLMAVGALTGATGAFTTLMIGSALGAGYGVYQLSTGKLKRREAIPFGPFLAVAALVTLLDVLPPGFPFFLTAP